MRFVESRSPVEELALERPDLHGPPADAAVLQWLRYFTQYAFGDVDYGVGVAAPRKPKQHPVEVIERAVHGPLTPFVLGVHGRASVACAPTRRRISLFTNV